MQKCVPYGLSIGEILLEFLALDIGAKGKNYMKKNTKYTNPDEKLVFGKEVKNLFPQPHEFVFKKSLKKVTIALESESIAYFKNEATRLHTPYQHIIRDLLAYYAQNQSISGYPHAM